MAKQASSPIDHVLADFTAAQIGSSVAASTAGWILARLGAHVVRFPGETSPDPRTSRGRVVAIAEDLTEPFAGAGSWHTEGSAVVGSADIVVADAASTGFLTSDGSLALYRELVARFNTCSWVTLSPWGIEGPNRFDRGDELPILAAGGLTHYMRNSAGRPMKPAGFAASVTAGQFAALAALHGVLLSGRRDDPVHLDLSMQDAIVVAGVFMECTHLLFNCSGDAGARRYAAPRGLVTCNDGYIQLVIAEDHQWLGCVKAMGNPAWAEGIVNYDERRANAETIQTNFEAWASTRTRREAVEALQANGAPVTPVNSCSDLIGQPDIDVRREFFRSRRGAPGEIVPDIPVGVLQPDGPLRGVREHHDVHRILDATHVLAGPLATAWLGAMGVEVLKLEDSDRLDSYRARGPYMDGTRDIEHSGLFSAANYSKRSVAVTLNDPEDHGFIAELAAASDLIVTNWSRHRIELLDSIVRSGDEPRPAMIRCVGFGATTASAAFRAYGMNTQGAGAVVDLSRDRFGEPRNIGTPWGDPLASIWVATLAAAQLVGRDMGVDLAVAMVEAVAFTFPEYFAIASATGADVHADESRLDHAAPHGIYSCLGDDQWIALSIETDRDWQNLVAALGSPSSLARPTFETAEGRLRGQDAIDEALDAELARLDKHDALDQLRRGGIACAPVLGAEELVNDAHLAARGLFQQVHHPIWGSRRTPALPWRIDGEGPVSITAAPVLGEYPRENAALLEGRS